MEPFGAAYEFDATDSAQYHVRTVKIMLNHLGKQCRDRGIEFDPRRLDIEFHEASGAAPGRVQVTYRGDPSGLPSPLP